MRLAVLIPLAALMSVPGSAQEEQAGGGTVRIDILVDLPSTAEAERQCEPVAENGQVNGGSQDPIIVCGIRGDDDAFFYSGDAEAAEDRHARETAFAGTVPPPDIAGPGIFRGPATASGICGIGLNPCPPPPAVFIDVGALPQAPEGSAADRIAQGLEPEEDRDADREELSDYEREELGLPPRPAPTHPAKQP